MQEKVDNSRKMLQNRGFGVKKPRIPLTTHPVVDCDHSNGLVLNHYGAYVVEEIIFNRKKPWNIFASLDHMKCYKQPKLYRNCIK
jgi:hypothetical protein